MVVSTNSCHTSVMLWTAKPKCKCIWFNMGCHFTQSVYQVYANKLCNG